MKKLSQVERRHRKIRSKISGTVERPRVSVFRSNHYIYVQIIDDQSGKTLVSVHSKKAKTKSPSGKIKEIGLELASQAKKKNISKVVFDRGGYLYGGKIKVLADSLREGGLEF